MTNAAGGGGGGSIKVTPEALNRLADQIGNEVRHANQVANKALNRADVSTGVGEVDASLGSLSHTLRGEFQQLDGVGERLERSVAASAQNYRETESGLARLLTPGGGQTGRDGTAQPSGIPDYMRGMTEGTRQ